MRLMSVVLLFILAFFYSTNVFAYDESKPSYTPIVSINEKVNQLLIQSESTPLHTELMLKESHIDFLKLNPAEQYLYLMILANIAKIKNQHNEVITYLLQAQELEPIINEDQLSQLSFLNLYKKLARSYAKVGQFKKAYDANHTYITKYDVFMKSERDKYIFELEDKYETKRKKDINALLNNQTELKALEIDESLHNEILQRRNIYIISFLVFIFLLLLLRLLSMNKRIHELSKEDMLTGARNRKTLFRYGKSAIKRCIENKVGLCLLAVNIDGFKGLNEIHGDYIGDEVLKRFVLLGTESMRTRDIFARLEDATFIIVLPEASEGEAKAIAQHLKEKVAAFNFDYVGIHQQLDISVSIVELSESLNNFELLLNTAMNVLYEMRDGDSNQIKIYQQ
ncbi:GGDEF domain-containing protein [Pseudocolwellia agarivorans]|uniref:GGDEF domain-containing protein n=1 Tax=Pseudocolwellia agarivorans TaxID=1911682 RepID=UPI000984D56F|nr:GGDEF domain-containing protein [Pseudocolwellia agarivorans]